MNKRVWMVLVGGCLLLVTLSFTGVLAQPAGEVDALVTPKRAEVLVTVGGASADLPAYTSRAIQLAVEAVRSQGGGTVRLNPGTFEVSAPIRLYSNMALEGSGPETVLRKTEGFRTSFVIDADWGMIKATVQDSAGFRVGDGIQLYDDANNQGWEVTTAVITDIDGNVIYFDNPTVNDYIASKNGTVSNSISIVSVVDAENVRIARLLVDGNKETNDYINGCRGGGIYIHKSRNCEVDEVHVRNFNGDSFSWQVTENITVRNSEASYGGGLGFHPGTGSDRSVVEGNTSHHNKEDGFFLCWRVQNGVFRDNVSYANQRYGISIGHKDTDNLFVGNHIYENARHGIYFRDENEQNGGHRNTFRQNIVENNGTTGIEAYGFYIGGNTNDIVIEGNTIQSTGKGTQVGAIYIGSNAKRTVTGENTIAGHPGTVKE